MKRLVCLALLGVACVDSNRESDTPTPDATTPVAEADDLELVSLTFNDGEGTSWGSTVTVANHAERDYATSSLTLECFTTESTDCQGTWPIVSVVWSGEVLAAGATLTARVSLQENIKPNSPQDYLGCTLTWGAEFSDYLSQQSASYQGGCE